MQENTMILRNTHDVEVVMHMLYKEILLIETY